MYTYKFRKPCATRKAKSYKQVIKQEYKKIGAKLLFLLNPPCGRFNGSIGFADRIDKPIDNLMNSLTLRLENRLRFSTGYRLRLSQVTATLQQAYPHFEPTAHRFSIAHNNRFFCFLAVALPQVEGVFLAEHLA